MAKSLLQQKMATTPPDGAANWAPHEAALEILGGFFGLTTSSASDEYGSNLQYIDGGSAITSAVIPVGALGWAILVTGGSISVAGQSGIPAGTSFRGGGYLGKGLKTAILADTLSVPGNTAFIFYDLPA